MRDLLRTGTGAILVVLIMLIGSFGLIITLGMVAWSFYATSFNGWMVPVFLFIYIAFFAFSQGAVIWVFISEIFPNPVRAKGQTLGDTLMILVDLFARRLHR